MVEYYYLIHVHGQKNSLSVLVIQVTWLLPLGYSFKQKDNNYVTPEKGGWQGLCLAQFLINIIDIAVSLQAELQCIAPGEDGSEQQDPTPVLLPTPSSNTQQVF